MMHGSQVTNKSKSHTSESQFFLLGSGNSSQIRSKETNSQCLVAFLVLLVSLPAFDIMCLVLRLTHTQPTATSCSSKLRRAYKSQRCVKNVVFCESHLRQCFTHEVFSFSWRISYRPHGHFLRVFFCFRGGEL
eukprot:Gregarina_sp_Poly_1__11076@NODE_890_length_5837_cov_53_476430_g634_i0_p6_GENE_NODE_890_length_5837_cov_53_476430_g634_i0NODE_890_length_5837_cov_53_476430_g634_i0_p6_ORF_typecomplete_len133_score4_77DUF1180/PF06679_12/0_025BAMBI/PF06211_12/0_25_NODE_890_length_5837_cov_53_476430_g634_i027993197